MPGTEKFASKPTPSGDKLRGGFYTPQALGRFLATWVKPIGPRILEPSCGDGNLLRSLRDVGVEGRGVTAVEIAEAEAAKAADVLPQADVIAEDLFQWLSRVDTEGCFDGVIGNPPFIRFGNWQDPSRTYALEYMRDHGMSPNRLTNAWVPFVVAASKVLRDGGRLGLVVPAELLQVAYSAELRGVLVDECSDLIVVGFKRLVFESILQEVVLLLGVRGAGPARIRVMECEDAESLPDDAASLLGVPRAPALRHDEEKWTKYFLEPGQIRSLRRIRMQTGGSTLGDFAEVDVGIVTGRNRFFVMRPSEVEQRRLSEHVVPLVGRSAQLHGVVLNKSDAADLVSNDSLCRLLSVRKDEVPRGPLAAYIEEGEAEGVHTGYKCSTRKPWWTVPSPWVPDLFLLRQIYEYPRLIHNGPKATCTDTIHRVRVKPGVDARRLAAASINSLTFAFAEIMGRSYGGGVLELEPGEAEMLPFPDPSGLSKPMVKMVDRQIRAGDVESALDLVDSALLCEQMGLSQQTVGELRAVWSLLRERRLRRGGTRSNALKSAA